MGVIENFLKYKRYLGHPLLALSKLLTVVRYNVALLPRETVNKCEIMVIALQRSGHHAIINWIRYQLKGCHCFLNHCHPNANPYQRCYRANSCFRNVNIGWIEKARFINKDCLIYNYEDCALGEIPGESFNRNHDEWVGRSLKKIRVLILRDAFNFFASRLKRHYSEWGKENMKLISDAVGLWKSYAEEYLGVTNYFPDKVLISYNRWVEDRLYRIELSEQIGVPFSDKGKDEVAKYTPGREGASFDDLKYDGNASKMKVLERWKYFVENDLYRSIFKDRELVELSDRIFGEIPGTHTLLDR